MSQFRVRIADFDGTWTDAEEEGKPFRVGYLQDLAALAELPLDEVERLAGEFERAVAADPGAHGWQYAGKIVAPAMVDPYLRIQAVAGKIFDRAQLFLDAAEREQVLNRLFRDNYPKSGVSFRPGALGVLDAALRDRLYIVTNSGTEPVCAKLEQLVGGVTKWLGFWMAEHVFGGAKKYVVEDSLFGVPETMELPGLARPVFLRRPHYYKVLEALRTRHGARWDEVVVVGDIFELDLALPLALGAQVGLLANEYTPPYELQFLREHPRARLLGNMAELTAFLQR